ncbi:hypothetical protein BACI349Y_450015 [Bacillus sp. 349Y]|nr:hypothetical protein BACI349Y_450015 [Bacillus sp. 349Y]
MTIKLEKIFSFNANIHRFSYNVKEHSLSLNSIYVSYILIRTTVNSQNYRRS